MFCSALFLLPVSACSARERILTGIVSTRRKGWEERRDGERVCVYVIGTKSSSSWVDVCCLASTFK